MQPEQRKPPKGVLLPNKSQCSPILVFLCELNADPKGRHQFKKTFSFGHCPNHLTPPPDPNSGNLVLFFGRQKRRFARMTKKYFDGDNDGFNDNYDDNFGNFDDNYDKNY